MISTAQLRRQIQNDPVRINRLLRVIPELIQQERDNPQVATPRVLRRLRAHRRMVEKLGLHYGMLEYSPEAEANAEELY